MEEKKKTNIVLLLIAIPSRAKLNSAAIKNNETKRD